MKFGSVLKMRKAWKKVGFPWKLQKLRNSIHWCCDSDAIEIQSGACNWNRWKSSIYDVRNSSGLQLSENTRNLHNKIQFSFFNNSSDFQDIFHTEISIGLASKEQQRIISKRKKTNKRALLQKRTPRKNCNIHTVRGKWKMHGRRTPAQKWKKLLISFAGWKFEWKKTHKYTHNILQNVSIVLFLEL